MEKRVASILLLLLVAGLSAAAGSGADTDVIRLPSDGNGNEEERPWECCDLLWCTRSQPPSCQCLDRVERCSDACRECVSVEGAREACADWYIGEPPPRCHKDAARTAGTVVTTGARKEKDDEERPPPWKCCDRSAPGPSTTWPPVRWYCMDKFERCHCEHCMEVEDGHSYFCLDGYKGRDPGPSCAHHYYKMVHRRRF